MAKLIFTSRYLKSSSAHLVNYVEYIGTRQGVEMIDQSAWLLRSTVNQKKLMKQILHDLPETKNMLEYQDYYLNPTVKNASEFITCALEQNYDLIGTRKNYVDYIANRPRAEKIGTHGLFSDAGKPVILSQVQNEVANHQGVIWTHVISLRREDAERLGYADGKQWRELIRSKKAMLSRYMRIASENLRWYGAFHNESHHPHLHLMVYSIKKEEGFLTRQAIDAMRSEIAHDIFRQDFANIYDQQNQSRKVLKQGAEDVMKGLLSQISRGICENKVIEEKILLLANRLKNTTGKKVYGYLKADVKIIVDQIVEELSKEESVATLYKAWYDWKNEIHKTYSNHEAPFLPLVKQKQFKSIKNMVISEALNISNGHFSFEDEAFPDVENINAEPNELEDHSASMEPEEQEGGLAVSNDQENSHALFEPEEQKNRGTVTWNESYQQARRYLFGSDTVPQNFTKAFELFFLEAQTGNALAMFDLGRMYADGLGREIDTEKSFIWYQKALQAFHMAEKEETNPYTQYRIGKMYAAGLGTGQNYEEAVKWFLMAVSKNHKYAQYSLGGLTYRGHGISQSYETAFELYLKSAKQGNPYARYEAAKMILKGIGTIRDEASAGHYFKIAFSGFLKLEQTSHDDQLQYRIGQMLYSGNGVEKNIPLAISYLEKAATSGNVNAQYLFGKALLETGAKAPEEALEWIVRAAESGNANAQYNLGKLYRDGTHVSKDIAKALQYFRLSAEQGNDYAAYQLGLLYLKNEDVQKDINLAIQWLTASADSGNQHAQYAFAKLYLTGEDVNINAAQALSLFLLSAEQGNEYAAYQLGKIYLKGEATSKNVDQAVYWLTASAEQGNPFAQYLLGKLYFFDGAVPQDKEKSLYWLTASAAQGNIYASYLMDHINRISNPSVLLAATRLVQRIENLFIESYFKSSGSEAMQIDRRRRKQLQEKKRAIGHAPDDHEPIRQQTQ